MNSKRINENESRNNEQFYHCPKIIQLNQIHMNMISNGRFNLLKTVAMEVGLSERTCQRHFKAILGMRYQEIISKYQKKTAKATRDWSA